VKPKRILLIACGAENQLFQGFKSKLLGTPQRRYCFSESQLSLSARDKNEQIVLPSTNDSAHDLVLLGLPAGQVEEYAGVFFELIRHRRWKVPVVAVCCEAQPDDVEKLRRLGVIDVWANDLNPQQAIARLLGDETAEPENASLRTRLGLGQLVGESPTFLAAIKQVPSIARYQTCVLLSGETGTGKEVFARAIHYNGVRSAKPFIPVNCGAIPVDLLENEFFGHESGAFTSASSSRRGLLTEADGGTLFLDEVDCLPAMAQVKLLRFLQDGHFRPLGSERVCSSDVRVIAASNTNLPEAVEAGRFRKDLFYRLNVVLLKLPPLRDRGDDVILLARHMLAKFSAKLGAPARDFAPGALFKLACHNWPGNVRELENVVQRAIVAANSEIVSAEDICLGEASPRPENQNFRNLKARAVAEFERTYVRQLLISHGGNITNAAHAAGKDRRAFWELMRKHQIEVKPLLATSLTGPDKISPN
jgi:DNA-binding NtrC family response regulator